MDDTRSLSGASAADDTRSLSGASAADDTRSVSGGAFAANPSSETFQPMIKAMREVSDLDYLYGRIARRHGIELP